MSNKIKIVASFILGLFCFVSCAFDGNIGLYEIKINDWAEITYWLQNNNDTSDLGGFRLYATQRDLEVDKRYELDDYDRDNEISQLSSRIFYNNHFIIADDGFMRYEEGEYYLITPIGDRGGGKHLPFTSVQITREEYDSIEANCLDCKVLDISILKKMHYEEEQNEKNRFPTKTVVFIWLLTAYVIYRFYKTRSKNAR